jgi:hypothetical protein
VGLQQQCLAPVAERPLEPVGEPAVGQFGESLLRERRAGAIAAEMCEPFTVVFGLYKARSRQRNSHRAA